MGMGFCGEYKLNQVVGDELVVLALDRSLLRPRRLFGSIQKWGVLIAKLGC